MKRSLVVVACWVFVASGALPARATAREVAIADNSFTSATLDANVGDTVHWSRASGTGTHSVHEDGNIFDSGDPASGAIDFTVLFSAGTFHYYCEAHGSASGGMAGVVRVPVSMVSAPAGRPFTVRWAYPAGAGTRSGTSFDVNYRVDSGPWKRWWGNTSGVVSVFGQSGAPMTVTGGHTYSFRARSRAFNGDVYVASGHSPVRTWTT
jgi:plastocyanin